MSYAALKGPKWTDLRDEAYVWYEGGGGGTTLQFGLRSPVLIFQDCHGKGGRPGAAAVVAQVNSVSRKYFDTTFLPTHLSSNNSPGM